VCEEDEQDEDARGGQRTEETSSREKPEDLSLRRQQGLSSREKQPDLNTGEQQDLDLRKQRDSKLRQQDSKSNSTRRFLKEMYGCPSWILSTPFGPPSPLALTVANYGNQAADVGLNGNLDLASEILLDIVAPTPAPAEGASVASTLTWDSTLEGDSSLLVLIWMRHLLVQTRARHLLGQALMRPLQAQAGTQPRPRLSHKTRMIWPFHTYYNRVG